MSQVHEMFRLEHIAGVVTLYNPPLESLEHIGSYAPYLDILFVVDNSPKESFGFICRLKEQYKNVEVLSSGRNLGVAGALNLAIDAARKRGAVWLLTMDQDSWFRPEVLNSFFELSREQDISRTAILSPLHKAPKDGVPRESVCRKRTEVMTSGNLLNLALAEKIGPFNEELFIDSVDHEYCMRANLLGFDVLQAGNCLLEHTVGCMYSGHFLFGLKRKTFSLHQPKRMYFIVRNTLYMRNRYGEDFPEHTEAQWRHVKDKAAKCLKYSNDRQSYLKYILKGWLDYRRGYYGNAVNI